MTLHTFETEMKLGNSEQGLPSILKSIGDGAIVTDKEGFVTFMNPVAETLTGWKNEDALSKNLTEILHLEDEERHHITENFIANILSEGNAVNLANQPMLITNDGTEISVDVSASHFRDEQQNIASVVLVFRNISERKLREEVLRQKEVSRRIFTSSPAAITIADINLKMMDCNQAALDLFGYSSKEEIIGKNVIDFVAPKDHQRVINDAKKLLKQSLLKNVEYTFLTKDGDEFIALISLNIIKDTASDSLYLVGIIQDITEIKLSKQKLQAVFDGIKDGILIIDQNYKILMANLEVLRIYNKKNFSELIGKSCFRQLFKNESVCDICPVHDAFKTGNPSNITRIWHGNEKEKILLDISSIPIKDQDGKVVQVIEFMKNVTDKIKLEDQAIAQERMAAIGELASGIAHEIRNPLGNISASAQYCLNRYKLSESVKKYFKIVLRNSDNANRVIKDLLNFTKPREISFKMGDISRVIKNTCNLIRAKCFEQNVHLVCRLPRGLPQILLDEKRLIEVFSNIILNSLDAMPDGGRLTVTAYGNFQNNEVVVSFLDTGRGIPQENMNKIFEPFFTTKTDGIGLGLCLALQVISDHKGKINIESKVGSGTEVIVRLPISSE